MLKKYHKNITASINNKGVLDIDTVKGCSAGMAKYPTGGCYGLCYAAKLAKTYGYDFTVSVSRRIEKNNSQLTLFPGGEFKIPSSVFEAVSNHVLNWFRIGTMGDPSHNWKLTALVSELLGNLRTPVIVTKHWIKIPDNFLPTFKKSKAVFNTSVSALDNDSEINHRLDQYKRLLNYGIKSYLRIVSCEFGITGQGKMLDKIQTNLFKNDFIIDNPLRIPASDSRVISGDIIVRKEKDLNSEISISKFNNDTFIGHCSKCPDQCGVL